MTKPTNDLEDASFGMYDHFLPSMKAASYTLNIESKMTSRESGEVFHHEIREFGFVVDAPRFTLVTQDEVRSCSPPHGGNADYRGMLPHIVLNNRALPWERSIDPESARTNERVIPWMALLLLTNDEMAAENVRLQELRASDWQRAEDGIVVPAFKLTPGDKDENVTVLDISARLFRAVCPRVNELDLLAHVRRVRVDEKHGDFIKNERDFSILMSNRIVQPGANVMLLVSLEGWRDWLEHDSIETNKNRLRVVVLHSWNFFCDVGDGSFCALIKKLDAGLFSDRVTVAGTEHAALQSIFAQGYTAIAYEPDGSDRTFAWYRGPLSPALDARFGSERKPFESADSAIVIEASSGMLDVSLSSAFQLGRLLALGSVSFGTAVRRWNHLKQLDALATHESKTPRTSLVEEMARYAASHVLGGEQSDGTFDDVKRVSEWLVALRLLKPVPLHYLVPAGSFLPAESLRFFYLDENWLDAMTDGALSLGASWSSAQWFLQSNRGTLRQTLRAMMTITPRNASSASKAIDDDMPMTGFLLRSSLLKKVPGLEVECLASGARTEKLNILRMDLIGEDLLLVLVLGKPEQIRFKLPREGMTFGYDASGLRARITRAAETNLGARDANVPPLLMSDYTRIDDVAKGVLDIRRLHNKLEGEEDKSGARFALHWLNGLDDALIRWEHASERDSS
jgi:hypothetical protein